METMVDRAHIREVPISPSPESFNGRGDNGEPTASDASEHGFSWATAYNPRAGAFSYYLS
jgi:hypothetical protein